MTVIFYSHGDDGYERIGRVENGEIVEGEDELGLIVLDSELDDEEGLIEHYNGPYVVASMYPDDDFPEVEGGGNESDDVDEDERAGDPVPTEGEAVKSEIAEEMAEAVGSSDDGGDGGDSDGAVMSVDMEDESTDDVLYGPAESGDGDAPDSHPDEQVSEDEEPESGGEGAANGSE